MTFQTLAGKTIVLGVTGSIAAVEVVKLAHALRRRGAEVQGVMSPAAAGILHPDALTYATGWETITRCSGQVEHVEYCGEGGRGDLLLIAPCTANTLGKIASAIDDTAVTTFATTAIGRGMPIVVAPAMHASMYRHPGITENIRRLEGWGIDVIPPRIEEGRAKIADVEEIVLHAERAVLGRPLLGKRVLITSGACREPLDDVRVLTTRSSGQMGRALALQAYRLGAEVTVVHQDTFPAVQNIGSETAAEMREEVLRRVEKGEVDIYISAAAISDFAPQRQPGKLESGRAVEIPLQPLPKLLDAVLAADPHPRTVAFKLGWDEEERARGMLGRGVDLVVVNTPDAMGASRGEFTLLTRDRRIPLCGSKEEVAAALWAMLL